jgi:hypothetical protein
MTKGAILSQFVKSTLKIAASACGKPWESAIIDYSDKNERLQIYNE